MPESDAKKNEIRKYFKLIDINKDGNLTKNEFREFIKAMRWIDHDD